MARGISIDEKYLGTEPTLTAKSKNIDVIRAYNWFNYFHNSDDAKKFVLAFLRSKKTDKATLNKVEQLKPDSLRTIGWCCRMLTKGGSLPEDLHKQVSTKLNTLIDSVKPIKKKKEEVKAKPSIQERIHDKTCDILGGLEEQVDKFLKDGNKDFDPDVWFKTNSVKEYAAKAAKVYYTSLYDELYEASLGKDAQLKEAYSHLKKSQLKKYMEFVKSIISAAEVNSVAAKSNRKPRKKKTKPATVLVAKMKYKKTDQDYALTSANPSDIIGASQLWTFNTKTRNLTVYDAIGPSGLSVKGTTIVGFDDKTSETKKLRKPTETIDKLMDGGKIVLRKLMSTVKCKSTKASGRINSDTILLRIIK